MFSKFLILFYRAVAQLPAIYKASLITINPSLFKVTETKNTKATLGLANRLLLLEVHAVKI